MEASVLYITHDIREAALLGDRVAVMEAGRLVATGTLAELSGLKSPIVREILDAPTWGTRGTSPPANHDALHSSERSEEHTSELQSLMRISYAVFCLKKKRETTH